ncbi:MAG TPA: hypothetical protein VF951_07760 [Streptosporangiaceae bacterium]
MNIQNSVALVTDQVPEQACPATLSTSTPHFLTGHYVQAAKNAGHLHPDGGRG